MEEESESDRRIAQAALDQFAGQAMNAIYSANEVYSGVLSQKDVPRLAYDIAESMMIERAKRKIQERQER